MKIAIINISYNCFDTLPLALESWIELKKSPRKEIAQLLLTSSAVCFKETADLGYPLYGDDNTIPYLSDLKKDGVLDKFDLPAYPRTEIEAWNKWLPWLFEQDTDLIWMVNSDEIWSIPEILGTLKFVQDNRLVDLYKVQFKNYIFTEKQWTLDFITPRLWWVNRNKKLKGFYQDDLVEYENGKRDHQVSALQVPRGIAFPSHKSWCGSPEKLKRKAEFGIKRYGLCSYLWDETAQSLKFNSEYYKKMGKPQPELCSD